MSDTIFYPDLKIVPVTSISLQEHVQKARMQKLADAIKQEGVLKNPPIVTNFTNGKYLHLDGANRITAVELLHYPNCLVQIVDYSDPTHVHLSSWSHLINIKKEQFLAAIKALPGVTIKTSKEFQPTSLLQPQIACVVAFSDGTIHEVTVDARFHDIINRLGDIVNVYDDGPIERVFSGSPWNAQSIQNRFERYSENNALIIFPTFSPQQVVTLVDKDVLMPAGVTRHVVYRRKLNVNLPLDYLNIASIEEANEKLQQFLQHRSVRLYEEPIIYFE
jgi:L-serine kinase (ATP) / ParB family transcriptional regulator, heme-responsive regulator